MPYHDYIEHFHNTRRRHSALGMLTPTEYEHRHSHTINAACLQQLNSTERGADHLSAWSAVYGWGERWAAMPRGSNFQKPWEQDWRPTAVQPDDAADPPG
jgi:hypothetical protein